ncbi:hypothetical protein ES705_34269 [subsurface metagenome]
MTVAEVIQALEEVVIDPGTHLSVVELHALHFAIIVLRSLSPTQVALIDGLLKLELIAPLPK